MVGGILTFEISLLHKLVEYSRQQKMEVLQMSICGLNRDESFNECKECLLKESGYSAHGGNQVALHHIGDGSGLRPIVQYLCGYVAEHLLNF